MTFGLGGFPDEATDDLHSEAGSAAGWGDGNCEQPGNGPNGLSPCDSRLLKKSLAQLEPQSERLMGYFLANLFVRNPELRPMFPPALDSQRHSVFDALSRYVWASDRPESLTGWLAELARAHRKFGVSQEHYQAFRDSLLAALRAFSGTSWAPQTQAAWERALGHMTAVMTEAGTTSAGEPAWWLAEVTEHDLRRPDLAVLTIRPEQPLAYVPGQHVSIQVPRWPRLWREYSVANAPVPDGTLRLHVRAVPGGMVSTVLVHHTQPGDTLIVGRASGDMTVDAVSSGTVVCVAGGTGLAPVKAIVEALTNPERPPPRAHVRLFFGARQQADLYDLADLRRLAETQGGLTVIPVVSDEPWYTGLTGMLPDAAAAHLPPDTSDIVVSGPPAMVRRAAAVVTAAATGARIHLDPLPLSGSLQAERPAR
jgi:NAD(P)H-flavin reductase/hemoglobin-like flavoprotein